MSTRAEVETVIRQLLNASEDRREVSLDEIGEAIGVMPFSTDDIDGVIQALERSGRKVTWAQGGGTEDLRKVIAAARAIQAGRGRRATVEEIAAHTGLDARSVRTALALARVMGR